MKVLWRKAILLAVAFALPGHVVLAQEPADPVSTARIRLGPLGMTPSVTLTNLGVDGNVFNTAIDPKKDFTFTLTPRLDAWFRAGRSRTSMMATAGLIYFHEYSSERSVDRAGVIRFEVIGNKLTPWVGGGFANAHQRTGYEIDARSRRVTHDLSAGIDARIASKTQLGFTAQRNEYVFDADAVFEGTSLQETLNRTRHSIGVEYRLALTPLTTFVTGVDGANERFQYSPERDSDSIRWQAGFDLSPPALIGGRARLGYRKFVGVDGGIPEFSGLVGSASTSIVIAGRTQIELAADRDVTYSFEPSEPYYVITGGTLTATPKLTNKWDLRGRVGRQRLAYRNVNSSTVDRVDHYRLLGVGIGYTLRRDTRFGVDLDHQQRTSPSLGRNYEGYRIGTSVTYGP